MARIDGKKAAQDSLMDVARLAVAAAYRAAGKPGNLTVIDGGESQREAAAVEWLMR